MKKFILFVVFIFTVLTVNAEVYLTYDSSTDEVKDLSKREDVVLQEGWVRIKLPGALQDYNGEFQYHPTMYKYKNGKIILNIKKLSDETLAEEEAREKAEELQAIENQIKLNAMKELEAQGKQFKHIKESDFKKED